MFARRSRTHRRTSSTSPARRPIRSARKPAIGRVGAALWARSSRSTRVGSGSVASPRVTASRRRRALVTPSPRSSASAFSSATNSTGSRESTARRAASLLGSRSRARASVRPKREVAVPGRRAPRKGHTAASAPAVRSSLDERSIPQASRAPATSWVRPPRDAISSIIARTAARFVSFSASRAVPSISPAGAASASSRPSRTLARDSVRFLHIRRARAST